MQIDIYTDGSARGNPGPGGYGVVLKQGKHYKELSAGYRNTTNNRMELLAVIKALEALKMKGLYVRVHTDSKYVCDAVTKGWLQTWVTKNFAGKKNADLWKQYIHLAKHQHMQFVWIKGHAGHTENERCDQLATHAADTPQSHLIDEGFESGQFN